MDKKVFNAPKTGKYEFTCKITPVGESQFVYAKFIDIQDGDDLNEMQTKFLGEALRHMEKDHE